MLHRGCCHQLLGRPANEWSVSTLSSWLNTACRGYRVHGSFLAVGCGCWTGLCGFRALSEAVSHSLSRSFSLSPSLTLKYKITSHARIFLQRDIITITTTSPGASVRERERETWIMILIPVKSLHRIADEWQCHGYIVGWRRRRGASRERAPDRSDEYNSRNFYSLFLFPGKREASL